MNNEILVEKYRPQKLSEVCGQDLVKKDLLYHVENKSIPHLLFFGNPGIGKTTTAIAIGKEILGSNYATNFQELNASDERGIDVIRDKVKYFAKSLPIDSPFKIILLDECDALTSAAQNALRRIMEKYSNTCRFILCCNNISQIIPAIQSRCVMYNFLPLKNEDIVKRLRYICDEEGRPSQNDALEYIAESADGDIRRAIMRLQSIESVSMDSIYNDKFEGNFFFIIQSLFVDKDFLSVREGIKQFQYEGASSRELILRLHNYSIKNPKIVPINLLPELLKIFRQAERDEISGLNSQINLDAMVMDILKVVNI